MFREHSFTVERRVYRQDVDSPKKIDRRLKIQKFPTRDVLSRVRLTKTPAEYLAVRERRRELPYEAMLASGRTSWSVGDRVRVYRKRNGGCGLLEEWDDGPVADTIVDARGYDVDHYVPQLRQTFASRLALRDESF
jgi:hypothetical protein